MRIYNSMTKQKEEFAPHGKRVNLFVCGPTVYSSSHIGHARTYIFFDVMARYMRSQGHDVFYLQNITDIDDKIIHWAKELGKTPAELAREETEKYKKDMTAIKAVSVTEYAAASDHIPEIIAQIARLIETGHAYESGGSVYYDISTFPDFGKLSHQNLDALQKAARTEDDPNKKHAHDFVLWRGRLKDSREPIWDSPWGTGRPGWHIEDTAITEKYFGPQYDIHGGGIELAFPHHEAEIAQMEGISGKHPLARIWMHTGWVTVKGEKMSKSLGNFIRIEDILKSHSPEALRLLMLQTSYQSPLEYSKELIQAAENVIQNIRKIYAHLRLIEKRSGEHKATDIMEKNLKAEVEDSMNDNFNTPKALLALYNLIDWTEQLFLEGVFGSETIGEILNIFGYFEKIFGIIPPKIPIPDDIREKAKHREALRAEKKWAESDAVRVQVLDLGYELSDTPDGTIILPRAPRG